jgi:hypothetical protein
VSLTKETIEGKNLLLEISRASNDCHVSLTKETIEGKNLFFEILGPAAVVQSRGRDRRCYPMKPVASSFSRNIFFR